MALREVLIIDDSPTMRMLVGFSIGAYADCVLREAGDGVEGLNALRTHTPDLIICDINMPRMNGFDLIEAVRAEPRWAKLPIVVLTTEGSQEDIRRGMSAGATAYLVKPFQPAKLHGIVDKLFESVPAV